MLSSREFSRFAVSHLGFVTAFVLLFFANSVAAGIFEDSVAGRPVKASSDETEASDEEDNSSDGDSEASAQVSTSAGDETAGQTDEEGATSEEGPKAPPVTESDTPPEEDTSEDEEDYEEDDSGGFLESVGLGFDLNGHLRGDMYIGKMPDYSRAVIQSGYGELGLKLRVSKSPYGDAYGDFRFKAGYMDDHYLGQPSDSPPSPMDRAEFGTNVDLREAYVNAYIGPLDLRLGKQIIVWGRADGINPTNNITPFDLRVRSPEEDDRRLGNVGLRAQLNLDPVRLEAVWMPIYSPSYLPEINLSDAVVFNEPDYPSVDLLKGTAAGRFHLIFSSFEMSLSYLFGYSPQPGVAPVGDLDDMRGNINPDPDVKSTIQVRRTAYQHHVAGFDFSASVKDYFSLRGELAYKHPKGSDKKNDWGIDGLNDVVVHRPDPDLYYVFGGDKEIGPVSLILQYVGRYVFQEKAPDPLPGTGDLDLNKLDELAVEWEADDLLDGNAVPYTTKRELLLTNRLIHGQKKKVQHGVFGRIEYKTLHDALSLQLYGMLNVSTMEWVIYPKLLYSITDAMTVTVGGEVYRGPDDTLFNYIEEILTAGYTELKISF